MKSESEKITRKKRINTRLTSAPLNWTVIPWNTGLDTSSLKAHAVEEFPTPTGEADYALFVSGQLLAIIEAKRLSTGVYSALEQAKRYAKAVNNTVGQWRGYKVPFLYSSNVEKLDIPNHAFDVIIADECHRGYSARELGLWKQALDHFDGIKIGLTATPASHSVAMFNEIIYAYSTDEAVEDGWLVDYDAVNITSHIKINGAFLAEGEKVGDIDRDSGKEFIYQLEDEREFNANDIEVKVTSPDSTEKIIRAVKKYTDRHEREYKRFSKMLIFAVHDIEHISHADEIVMACRRVFQRGDDFVVKITGKVDRPLEKVTAGKEFSPEQQQWLTYIRDHLSENLAIDVEDFGIMPVFERHGGLGKAKKVFGSQLTKLVEQLNTAMAS